MTRYTLVILVANATVLCGSSMIALVARRAFQRTQIAALRTVILGFVALAVGAAAGGSLYGIGYTAASVLAQSIATALGVGLVCYSLYQTSTDDLATPSIPQ